MSEKSQKEMLLFLLDETWALVESSINGLTSEEFYWKPVPGAFEPEAAFQEMVPGVSSIGFKLAHLAINKILVVDTFTGNGKLTIDEIAKLAPKQFAGWMEFVRETHAAFRRCLLEMPNEALGSKKLIWGDQFPAWQIWIWIINHDGWHAGQIKTLRVLYQHKGAKLA
ncbi:MAG: DinB family protein [bacterium]